MSMTSIANGYISSVVYCLFLVLCTYLSCLFVFNSLFRWCQIANKICFNSPSCDCDGLSFWKCECMHVPLALAISFLLSTTEQECAPNSCQRAEGGSNALNTEESTSQKHVRTIWS